jgi:hypothetical protein
MLSKNSRKSEREKEIQRGVLQKNKHTIYDKTEK